MILLALDWTQFFGRFHPLIIHLPIGIIVLGALFYWMSFREKWSRLKSVIAPILLGAAITSTFSVVFGLMLASDGSYAASSLTWHKWSGIITAIATWGSYIFYTAESKPSIPFKASFYIMLVSLILAGHKGGQITHGKNYLLQYAPGFLVTLFNGSIEDNSSYFIAESNMDSTEAFRDIIKPMLDAKCIQCHNPDKSNGGLVLTSFEAILDGGNSGEVLQAGDVFESKLFARTTLPQSSSKFMPLEGIPFTYKEQEIMAWWIETGHEEFLKLRSVEIPKNILVLLEELYGYSHKPKSFVEKNKVSPVDSIALAAVNKIGFHAKPIANNTNFLDVVVSPDISDITAEMVSSLAQIKEQVAWLAIPKRNLQDAMLQEIGTFTNLAKLKIPNNPISDQGLAKIKNLPNLEVLNVYDTKITDQSIANLESLKTLKNLYIWQTAITKEGLERLQAALPSTEIVSGFEFASNQSE